MLIFIGYDDEDMLIFIGFDLMNYLVKIGKFSYYFRAIVD